ncbi:hypothetical protein GCM10009017_05840 [Halarchaeum rubridurum]|uniref:Uncharacterized protein n=1 Tax=Halarchaeum rubridurum TaxID=489911 RepID=A0A830FK62_9EURY|nr:hypothetical protein GCM10009017_05840 [Halarchaeum rubridurum]
MSDPSLIRLLERGRYKALLLGAAFAEVLPNFGAPRPRLDVVEMVVSVAAGVGLCLCHVPFRTTYTGISTLPGALPAFASG